MVALTLVQQILFYVVEFIVITAVAVAGVLIGKKLRDRKDSKKEKDE